MNAVSGRDTFAKNLTIGQLVDKLGQIKARVAELTADEKLLKDMIIEYGEKEIEGDKFRVTVSTSERNSLDMEAVRGKLSPQFIAAHTTTTEVTTVRVVARTRK